MRFQIQAARKQMAKILERENPLEADIANVLRENVTA